MARRVRRSGVIALAALGILVSLPLLRAMHEPDAIRELAADARAAAADAWITIAVKLRLLASAETPALAIDVDTQGGNVTLFGIVDSQRARSAASQQARRVGGVEQLINVVQVVTEDDRRIVDAADEVTRVVIEEQLEEHDALAGAEIGVDVKGGFVRLTGEAPSERERWIARRIGASAPGASVVLDEIRVAQRAATSLVPGAASSDRASF